MYRITRKKILLTAVFLGLVAGVATVDLSDLLTLDQFLSQQAHLHHDFARHPLRTAALFVLVYIAAAGLSLPGGLLMTIIAGDIFGLFWGTLIVSFASTLAATLAFLASRYLFRDYVQQRFGARLAVLNTHIERDGAFYLFSLRLLPIAPFFVINLMMGVTPIPIHTFVTVSQVGMLIGTVVCVQAGTEIARIQSLSDVLSPRLIASLTLLAAFPLIARKVTSLIPGGKIKAALRGWTTRRFRGEEPRD